MSDRIDQALQELQTLSSTKEKLAVLEAIEKRRREDGFVRYWTPTEAQKPVLREFTDDIKIFGVLGGNRSGKTELGAFLAVVWALGKEFFQGEPVWEFIKDLPVPPPPSNIWVVGLDFPTLRDVIWREKLRLGRNHPPFVPRDSAIVKKVSDSDYQIFFTNGSMITGKSADSGREKFQGASVNLIWIDEEPEVDVYDECYQRTIDCNGKIFITLTPLSDINSGVRTPWVFDLYEKAMRGQHNLKFSALSMLDNPFVPSNEKEEAKKKWAGHPEEQARLYGGFVRRSGLVYPMWSPAIHMVPRFRIPANWGPKIVSIDPADTGTTAALWAVVDPFGNLYLTDEYYESDKVISDHASDIMLRNGGRSIDIWMIDPKYGSQKSGETHKTRLQLYREAMRVPVRLAPITEDYGLNVAREYLQSTVTNTSHPKVYVFNDLQSFRWEIEHYTWDFFQKGDQKGLSKDKPRKRHDHLMNSFQYLSSLRPKGSGRQPLTVEQKQEAIRHNSYT